MELKEQLSQGTALTGTASEKKGSTGTASEQIVTKIVEVVKPIVQADIALSLFLIVVEKLMETEFICPCNSSNNFVTNVLFSCSSFIIFFAMLYIKFYQNRQLKEDNEKKTDKDKEGFCSHWRWLGVFLSGVLVVFLWLFVLFFDGHYYVCKMSSWNGTWISNSTDVPRKWCKPAKDRTDNSRKNFNNLQIMSVELFFQSQVWLMHLL